MKLNKKLIIGTANFGNNYGLTQTKVNKIVFKKIINKCEKFNIDKFDISESYKVPKKYINKIKKKKIILKFNFAKYFPSRTNPHKVKKKILEFLIKNNLKKVDKFYYIIKMTC